MTASPARGPATRSVAPTTAPPGGRRSGRERPESAVGDGVGRRWERDDERGEQRVEQSPGESLCRARNGRDEERRASDGGRREDEPRRQYLGRVLAVADGVETEGIADDDGGECRADEVTREGDADAEHCEREEASGDERELGDATAHGRGLVSAGERVSVPDSRRRPANHPNGRV